FGENVGHMGTTDNPYTFRGKFGVMQEGGTGLFYAGGGYYNSVSARWLSRDLGAPGGGWFDPWTGPSGNWQDPRAPFGSYGFYTPLYDNRKVSDRIVTAVLGHVLNIPSGAPAGQGFHVSSFQPLVTTPLPNLITNPNLGVYIPRFLDTSSARNCLLINV